MGRWAGWRKPTRVLPASAIESFHRNNACCKHAELYYPANKLGSLRMVFRKADPPQQSLTSTETNNILEDVDCNMDSGRHGNAPRPYCRLAKNKGPDERPRFPETAFEAFCFWSVMTVVYTVILFLLWNNRGDRSDYFCVSSDYFALVRSGRFDLH